MREVSDVRRRFSVLAAALGVLVPSAAFAQGAPSEEPVETVAGTTAPTPAPSTPPAGPVTPANEPGKPGEAQKAPPEKPVGLLVPTYPEDRYPGEPDEDGNPTGVAIDNKGLRFAVHGYFRAPFRITKARRAEGSTKPNEGTFDYRTPYLIDDDYFRSGFAYTPVNETDFTELYLSVGNKRFSATIQFQGSLYSDAGRPFIDRQLGISQGWLTYRFTPDFVPFFKTRVRVKGGAFWDRFGHLPKYDTYIFGRTHQMGEQIRVELERDKTTLWLMHGVGTHLEDISANQGLTLINYASIGASYDRTIELGGYWIDAKARDKKPLKDLTDADMNVVGVDVRADTHVAGKLYGATSYLSLDQATFTSPVLEIMHSYGGRGITENYLGTQASENGTGSLWNIGFQYDLSLADTYKGLTGKGSPLPWNGDFNASLFGLYSFIQSKQASPDPLVNKDDHQSFKWGVDGGWRVTEWMAATFRYDRVALDTGDSANGFRILSPRLSFFTSFLTQEMLFIQYSRYVYNERIRLRPGQVQLESIPDDHVLKIQAQVVF